MARRSINLSELEDRALVVHKLSSLGQSLELTESQLQDKLTIHFQKKSSHGGDVLDVIYPLNSTKDDAIVIFEEAADRDSAVRHEQVFYGKTMTVTRLPPVFISIQAEIHPLYFKILPLRMADEFPALLQKVANAVVDKSNFGKISCSKPVDVECVEREVMQLVMHRGSKLTHNVSTLADDAQYDAAGSSNFEVETIQQAQRSSDLERDETRKSQSHYEEEMAQSSKRSSVMQLEKQDQFISAETSCNVGQYVSDERMHRESRALGRAGSHDESGFYPGQETHMTLDKYTYKYLEIFQARALQKLCKKYDIHLKTSPAKLEGHLEGVIIPRRTKTTSEDVDRAKDEFIILYQKAHVDITRKTLDCSAVQQHDIRAATKKILQDFKADTLLEEIDGSPHLRLILRHGDVEEVARAFRSYAGIKSGKTLRTTGTSSQNVKSQDEVSTSKGAQWDYNTQGTQMDSTQAPTEIPHQQIPSNPLWLQASQYQNNVSGESFVTNEGMQIAVIVGDITKLRVCAVVSPSDQYFSNASGVATALFSAAGPEMRKMCSQIKRDHSFQKLNVGECIVTHGFNLPCDVVIHAVGPSDTKDHTFGWKLYDTFLSCLKKAKEFKLQSLAVPLIGSGYIGAPKTLCADALAQALLAFSLESGKPRIPQIVYLVVVDSNSAVACSQALHAAFNTNAHFSRSREAPPGVHASQSISTDVRNPHAKQGHAVEAPPTDYQVSATNAHFSRSREAPAGVHASQSISTDVRNPHAKQGNAVEAPPTDYQVSASTIAPHSTEEQGSTSKDKTAADTLGSDVADTTPSASSTHSKADNGAGTTDEKTDECPICLRDNIIDVKVLDKCKHRFCKECIDKAMETRYTCPVCRTVCKPPKGNQPDGTMYHTTQLGYHLPGYPTDGTITIHYDIPGGIQKSGHPHPGKYFTGATRTAYLPDNQEGREVLQLLKKAFDARLVFTVGRSVTSSRDDIVTWNDIHHKTSRIGGVLSYGYPDPEYLKRVKADLAAKGISE